MKSDTLVEFINAELRRIEKAMTPEVEKGVWDQLDVAQQALVWVQNPDKTMSPHDLIMGIPPDSEGYSRDLRPPQS